MKCAICNNEAGKYGHNPQPLLPCEERVCGDCNGMLVIPARLGQEVKVTTWDGRELSCNLLKEQSK